MEEFLLSLQKSSLFANISEEELKKLYKCLDAKKKELKRESYVFHMGDDIKSVYFILSGNLHIINEDFWGNRSIIETMGENILFGEAYVLAKRKSYLVSVVAAEDTVLLEIDPKKLFEHCLKDCPYHAQIIRNALYIVSQKIVRLTEKAGHIMQRTIREKLLSYLSKCARIEKKSSFYIPYSRQQLADYLYVDRSALSHELSKLQKEGMIRYNKNYFELLASSDENLQI